MLTRPHRCLDITMAGKGFLVKVRLDLHAITCPGVWLCPSGKVALRITSLGSTLESHRVSPIFPLLFHNEFNFKKTFTRLAALTELQRNLERELLRAELIQWVGPCNRIVVLATFETDLADVLYPVSRCKRLPFGVDVDLLMDPMKPFPGIIAPKIEISTRTVIEEVFAAWSDETFRDDSKMIEYERMPANQKRGPAKSIVRQRRVCHNRRQLRTEISQAPRYRCSRSDVLSVCCPNGHPQIGQCCRATRERFESLHDVHDAPSKSHRVNSKVTRDNDRNLDDCPICSTYQCYFTSNRRRHHHHHHHHHDHDYDHYDCVGKGDAEETKAARNFHDEWSRL